MSLPTAEHWFHRRGQLARGVWESVVDDSIPGWSHTGLGIVALDEGAPVELARSGVERILVPLSGSFEVTWSENGTDTVTVLAGRESVFDGPSDYLYLSCDVSAVIRGCGRLAVASSPTDEPHPSRYIAAADVPVELRGAGASSRQVHNFGVPGALDAARLIVCEVFTPAGNWSSYPPHKHDEHNPDAESQLEEIYYFEVAPTNEGEGPGFGMFSTYSSPAGAIEIDARVATGDIALVPYGYHGPAVAAPGYDLYYLNVMAGPGGTREWLISDDPAHAWVRSTWDNEPSDPRLPLNRTKGTTR